MSDLIDRYVSGKIRSDELAEIITARFNWLLTQHLVNCPDREEEPFSFDSVINYRYWVKDQLFRVLTSSGERTEIYFAESSSGHYKCVFSGSGQMDEITTQ